MVQWGGPYITNSHGSVTIDNRDYVTGIRNGAARPIVLLLHSASDGLCRFASHFWIYEKAQPVIFLRSLHYLCCHHMIMNIIM